MNPYKIYIVQYSRRDALSREVLLGDPHEHPVDMGYFMWALTNGEHTVVVDMGFTEAVGTRRGRQWLGDPGERLDAIGIDPATVEHVIVTHLHYDHVGNYHLFPKARFYVQEDEMTFWSGRHARYKVFSNVVESEDIMAMVGFNLGGRVALIDGSRTILPGITVHGVGGHTKGMQIVEVETASGTAVVASDAAHTYRNFQEYTPFPILHDVPGMLDGFDRMYELASREDLILPGHDGQVMQRYPLVTERVALLE